MSLMEFKGIGATLVVEQDEVKIIRSRLLGMGRGNKTFPFKSITAIQFKKATLFAGYIQFTIQGGQEKGVYSDHFNDDNAITFGATDNAEALKVKEYLEARLREESALSKALPAPISPSDEIRKLKGLLDEGILTPEEFAAKKKQLLGL